MHSDDLNFHVHSADDGYNLVVNGLIVYHQSHIGQRPDPNSFGIIQSARSEISRIRKRGDSWPSLEFQADLLEGSLDRGDVLWVELQGTNITQTNASLTYSVKKGDETLFAPKDLERQRRPGIFGGVIFKLTFGTNGPEMDLIEEYQGPPPYLGIVL